MGAGSSHLTAELSLQPQFCIFLISGRNLFKQVHSNKHTVLGKAWIIFSILELSCIHMPKIRLVSSTLLSYVRNLGEGVLSKKDLILAQASHLFNTQPRMASNFCSSCQVLRLEVCTTMPGCMCCWGSNPGLPEHWADTTNSATPPASVPYQDI